MATAISNAADRDLRRDEARISLILAGGSARPGPTHAQAPGRIPRLAGAATAALVVGAAVTGIAWRDRGEDLAPAAHAPAPAPSTPVARPSTTVRPEPLPPLRPAGPLPVPSLPAPVAGPVAAPLAPSVAPTTRTGHRPVRAEGRHRAPPAIRTGHRLAEVHAAPRRAAGPGPAPNRAPAAAAPQAAGTKWIADPLYGEALRRAQDADARRAAELNRDQLRRLSSAPDR